MSNEAQEKEGVSRRGFLGLASMWTAIVSFAAVLGGVFKMSKATVHYEESQKFKIGKPDEFPMDSVKDLTEKNVYVFTDSEGVYAVSKICTHLGCIVTQTEWGFQCPCHGSRYNETGKVIGGPAPKALPWLEVSKHVDGNLVVDAAKEVKVGTKFKV